MHLSAVLSASASPTGSIAFADNGTLIANVPLNANGDTILGIASLAQGSHRLTANYSGDSGNSASTASLALIVSGLPATFTVSGATAYANSSLTLATLGLPSDASGSVTFTDGATTLATSTIAAVSTANYQAFGDSISLGQTLPSAASGYVSQLAAGDGLLPANYAVSGAVACDILLFEVLGNQLSATQASSPLSSLMVGTNDIDAHLSQPYEPLFRQCHQADLAWLAIPREYKILPGDPGANILSGAWTYDPGAFDLSIFGTLYNSSGNGTARYNITTAGAPIYLWYLIGELPGSFTIALDGVPTGESYSTEPPTPIDSVIAAGLDAGYALMRFPAAPGPHTVDITLQSGTAGVLAVGTAPSPGLASVHPTVLASDIPNQLMSNALIAAYTQDIEANVALLSGDGLDIRFVPTQQFMHGTPAEMNDAVDPNVFGHTELAQAFESVLGSGSTAPYTTFSNTAPTASVGFANPGTYTVAAAYSGDHTYSASTATTTLTIVPQVATYTTLAAPATHAYFGAPLTLTSTVSPASATGTVTFYDGTQTLAQLPVAAGAVSFTTATLAGGIHNLMAGYSGDTADLASASPLLQVEIEPSSTTVVLAPLAPSATYGSATDLSASISPNAATGSVSFYDSGALLGTATAAAGSASFNATLAVGLHTITASYSGDTSDQPASSVAVTTTIVAIATTTTLSPVPATFPYGSLFTLTANVSPAFSSGTVIFRASAGGTLAQTAVVNGVATISTNTLPIGNQTFTAIYSGDATHAVSSSQPMMTQIVPAPTSTTLATVPSSPGAGTPLTLTAQIVPASATGTVLFRDATLGTLGELSVVRGAASLTLPALPAAQYTITARYSGDTWNAPSTSAAISSQISLASTTTTLAVPVSAFYSAPVSASANVTPATATGLIEFFDGSKLIASTTLANGTATAQLTNLATGAHSIHATYLGDASYAGCGSESATIAIGPDPTSTLLTLAQAAVPAGDPVTFNVAVTNALANNPTGAVSLRSGATIIATGQLTNASAGSAYATLTAPSPALGVFSVVASYPGDANDLASTSVTARYTVIPAPTVATLTLAERQVPLQSTVTLIAIVSAATSVPAGSVVFASDGATIASVVLNGVGQASTTLVSPGLGTHAMTASYVPAGLFAAASAVPQSLTVTLPLALAVAPMKLNATPGSIETASLTIQPLSGFAGAIQAECRSPAGWLSCAVSAPASLNGPADAPVHIAIATSTAASTLPLLTLLLAPLLFGRRQRRALLAIVLSLAALSAAACTTGGTFFDVPNGPELLTLSVTAAGVTITTPLVVDITQ